MTSETTLEVRDVSRVAVLHGDQVALPADGAPTEAPLGTADVEVVPGGQAEVDVTAVRTPAGEISLKWATRPPIVTGEKRVTLPGASGRRWRVAVPETVDLTQPDLRWNFCAPLRPGACYALTIETPWSNVVVTRRTTVVPHTRPALQKAALVVAAPLLLMALLPAGTNFGSADGAILVVLGVSAGVTALVLGSSFLFPGPHTLTETVAPGSAAAIDRTDWHRDVRP
ncbi:MAG TPA: hypothetical protein VGL81_01670 [Polyangiaceae bacterium]